MLKKVFHCTLLDLDQYLPFKLHYPQRLPAQEVPKISMEIDYIGAIAPSAGRRLPDAGTHTGWEAFCLWWEPLNIVSACRVYSTCGT